MPAVEWAASATGLNVQPIADLVSRMWAEVIPGEPPIPAAELAAELDGNAPHRRRLTGVLRENDNTVAAAQLVMDDVEGRRNDAWLQFLVVEPAARRRGFGRQLLLATIEQAQRAGRHRLTHSAPLRESSGHFARSFDGRPGLLDQQNRVAAADLDLGLLRQWVRDGERRAAGYSLIEMDGVSPDELLESFTRLVRVMNTAPHSENQQDVAMTGEQIQENQQAFRQQGFEGMTLCARHNATGELVGFTELGFGPHRRWLALQGDTAVAPPHRRQGIGRWLKAANALRVLDRRPEVTLFETWNAGVNDGMLAINYAMGYRSVAEWQEWELEI